MERPKGKAKISELCVACGCCANVCPQIAIAVYRGVYAFVDVENCTGCGSCADECPAAVISIISGEAVVDEFTAKALV